MGFHEWELAMGLLGLFGALTVLLVYNRVPLFRRHPAEIVMLIAACDFMMGLRFVIRSSAWLANPDPPKGQNRSFNLGDDGCVVSVLWMAFWEQSALAWNGAWCVNTILLLRFPRLDTRTLVKYYHLYAWFSGTSFVLIYLLVGNYGTVEFGGYRYCGELDRNFSNPVIVVDFCFTLMQILIAFGSLVYSFHRLKRVRTQEARKLIIRHAAYVMVFFVLWMGQRLVGAGHYSDSYHQVMSLLWISQAFFLALVRLSETSLIPLFFESLHIPSKWLESCCHLSETNESPESENYNPLLEYMIHQNEEDFEMEDIQEALVQGSSWAPTTLVRAELEVVDAFGAKNRKKQKAIANDQEDFVSMYGDM